MEQGVEKIFNRLELITAGKPWYGESLFEKLDRVKERTWLTHSVSPINTTIAEYLAHMEAWLIYTIEMVRGNKTYRLEINSEADWPPIHLLEGKTAQSFKDRFQQLNAELKDALLTKEDSWLAEPIPDQFKYSQEGLLEGLIQHHVYHLGQIALIIRILEKAQPDTSA